jgi:hypothetical protein
MNRTRMPWLRGAASLAVLGALVGAVLASPVGAKKPGLSFNKLRRNVNVIYGSEAGPAPVADALTKIAQLDLPKGNYGIVAKVHLSTESAGGATIECALANGTTILDHGAVELPHAFQDVMTLTTATTLTGAGGTVELRCSDGDAAVATTWQGVSINAFKLPKLTTIDLTP